VAAIYLVTLAVNVTANAVFIPAYGAAGAGGANLVSSTLLLVLALTLAWRQGARLSNGSRLLKALAAATGMAVIVLATRSLPLPLVVVLGAATYVVALRGLRTLDADDLAMLPMGDG
jgi:O-antigen/teichoic acid export membrane protein